MTIGRIPSVEGGIQPTIVDAKGDLIVATAADTVSRLAVGTNDYVLTAASGETTGLKWAAIPAASFVGAYAYNNSAVSVNSGTWTAITLPSEFYDTDSIHSTSTNTSRFTIPTGKGGKWLVNFWVTFEGNNSNCSVQTAIYKNGSSVGLNRNGQQINSGERDFGQVKILDLAAGDYVELFVNHDCGVARNFYVTNTQGAAIVAYLGA